MEGVLGVFIRPPSMSELYHYNQINNGVLLHSLPNIIFPSHLETLIYQVLPSISVQIINKGLIAKL